MMLGLLIRWHKRTMPASEIEQILNDPVKFKALAKAAFDTVDTDNSGFIDETELKQVMI